MLRALQVSSTQLPDLLIDGDHIVGYESGRADIEIDGTGKTVIPGLIDAHTHNVDGDLEQALTFGVTTELDMFCLPSNLSRQRRIARERDDVADIRSAGVLATAPGGHPSQIMLADPSLKERYGDAVGPRPSMPASKATTASFTVTACAMVFSPAAWRGDRDRGRHGCRRGGWRRRARSERPTRRPAHHCPEPGKLSQNGPESVVGCGLHLRDPACGRGAGCQGILLPPAFAAVLMSASTVIVALNAQLLRRASL
jgi:hypothetical protein